MQACASENVMVFSSKCIVGFFGGNEIPDSLISGLSTRKLRCTQGLSGRLRDPAFN